MFKAKRMITEMVRLGILRMGGFSGILRLQFEYLEKRSIAGQISENNMVQSLWKTWEVLLSLWFIRAVWKWGGET
jgi:hypothetical protein